MKKEDKIISCCGFLFFLLIPIYHLWENNKIMQNPAITFGIVDKIYYAHYRPYFSYTYNVNGKKNKGSEKRIGDFCSLKVGDTINVNYDSASPNKSKPSIRKNVRFR